MSYPFFTCFFFPINLQRSGAKNNVTQHYMVLDKLLSKHVQKSYQPTSNEYVFFRVRENLIQRTPQDAKMAYAHGFIHLLAQNLVP